MQEVAWIKLWPEAREGLAHQVLDPLAGHIQVAGGEVDQNGQAGGALGGLQGGSGEAPDEPAQMHGLAGALAPQQDHEG